MNPHIPVKGWGLDDMRKVEKLTRHNAYVANVVARLQRDVNQRNWKYVFEKGGELDVLLSYSRGRRKIKKQELWELVKARQLVKFGESIKAVLEPINRQRREAWGRVRIETFYLKHRQLIRQIRKEMNGGQKVIVFADAIHFKGTLQEQTRLITYLRTKQFVIITPSGSVILTFGPSLLSEKILAHPFKKSSEALIKAAAITSRL